MKQFRPEARAETLSHLQAEVTALVDAAPQYGAVGIVLHFHGGELVRIERSTSELMKVGDGT